MRSNKTVGTPVARKSTEEIELTGRAVTRVKSPPEFSGVDHDLDRGPTATYRAAVSRATAPRVLVPLPQGARKAPRVLVPLPQGARKASRSS